MQQETKTTTGELQECQTILHKSLTDSAESFNATAQHQPTIGEVKNRYPLKQGLKQNGGTLEGWISW